MKPIWRQLLRCREIRKWSVSIKWSRGEWTCLQSGQEDGDLGRLQTENTSSWNERPRLDKTFRKHWKKWLRLSRGYISRNIKYKCWRLYFLWGGNSRQMIMTSWFFSAFPFPVALINCENIYRILPLHFLWNSWKCASEYVLETLKLPVLFLHPQR